MKYIWRGTAFYRIMDRGIKIVGIFTGVVVIGLLAFAFRPQGNDVIRLGDLIVSKPKGKFSYKVMIVWGGLDYANPDWMLSQVPQNVLDGYLLIFAPHNKEMSSIQNTILPYFNKDSISVSSWSLVGFSAGAKQVQKNYSSEYKFAGLIDPSTNSKLANKSYGDNTVMSYDLGNWNSYKGVKGSLPTLAQNISSGGGFSENINQSHKDFVRDFFNRHIK